MSNRFPRQWQPGGAGGWPGKRPILPCLKARRWMSFEGYIAAGALVLAMIAAPAFAGDELTADFARALITAEGLGDDEVTDYLAISFSATDYIGHIFGPSSLESEDNILRLDRTLAELFAFIDSEIGLDNTLIVLSSDHGAPEAPGYLESLGIPTGYVSPDSWD